MQKVICLTITVFAFTQILFSQVFVSGSQCVTTGTVYQYLVTGKFKSPAGLRVCITGGKLVDSANTCAEGMLTGVKVIWDENIAHGNVSISSSVGKSSLDVTIVSELDGGSIGTAKVQLTAQDSIPVTIRCQAANGGACNPEYAYQWEQSEDQAYWKDISNETEQNLRFVTVLHEAAFYRRKVTEANSGTIKYSDVASVFVTPKPNKK